MLPGRRGSPPASPSRAAARDDLGCGQPLETTRRLTTSFLGLEEDELTEPHTDEVICELANMVCGSALSRLDAGARFDLSHPEINPPEPVCDEVRRLVHKTLATEDGVLAFWLELEQC